MTAPAESRLGLVGAEGRGSVFMEALARTPHVQLAGVSSHTPETLGPLAAGCRVFPNWRALLDPRLLDGLIIATKPATHYAIAREALAAGLPVLLESPLALDLAEAMDLKRLADERALVMVDHSHLAHPACRFLKELAAGGAASPIRAIRGYAGGCGPAADASSPLWTWGARTIALCIDLLNASEPEDLSARVVKYRRTSEGEGKTIELRFDFAKDTDVRLRLSNILEQETDYFAVYFDQMTLVYDGLGADALSVHPPLPDFSVPTDEGQAVELPAEDPLVTVLRSFALAITNRTDDGESLNLGVDVVALLARCQAILGESVAPTPMPVQ